MEGNLQAPAAILGLLLFGIFFAGLILYTLARSWRRAVQIALDSVRLKLRQLHTRLNEFRASFQSFSPGDPEPFGPLVEAALDRSVGVELVLRGLFDRYAGIHENVTKLRATRDWNVIRLPVLWFQKRSELVILASEIVTFEASLNELFHYQERLSQLNSDVAKGCQAVLQKSNLASAAFEKLHQSGLGGQTLELAREEVRNWQSTILNQVPVLFFSTDAEIIRSQTDKDTTARVYRLSQTAEPAISRLLNQANEWSQNYLQCQENIERIKAGLPDIQRIIEELSHAESFPIVWEQTKTQIDVLSEGLSNLESLAASHEVADLKGLANDSNQLYEELIQISERLVDARSDHMELCSLSLSEEMENGPETLKSAYQLSSAISSYSTINFLHGDVVSNLSTDLKAIASLQGRFLRSSSPSEVNENELPKRLELARSLALQYKTIAPRLISIRRRLNEIQELERSTQKRLEDLRHVAAGLETLAQENQQLKKVIGTESVKIKSQAEGISGELLQKDKDTVEKKSERCQALYSRVVKELEKWSEQLSREIASSKTEISAQIGVLREIVWIDDPVMAESEHLLSSISSDILPGEQLTNQKDQLISKFEHLVTTNEMFKRHSNALQRIQGITEPILANYRQVERSRNSVLGMISKLNEIFPQNEEAWPPTTIRMVSEQVRVSQLEKEWASIKKDRMKAGLLGEKLSSLLSEYKSLETQLADGLNHAKQEQGRFTEYERRMQDSRRMWRRVAANHVDNRFVNDGVAQLFSSVDQEIQRLRARYLRGELNYSLALQGMKQICRKLDEGVIEYDQNQIIDINGEIQRRL